MPTASSDLDQRAISMGRHLSSRSKLSTSVSNHNYFLYFVVLQSTVFFFKPIVLMILVSMPTVLFRSPIFFDMTRKPLILVELGQ